MLLAVHKLDLTYCVSIGTHLYVGLRLDINLTFGLSLGGDPTIFQGLGFGSKICLKIGLIMMDQQGQLAIPNPLDISVSVQYTTLSSRW